MGDGRFDDDPLDRLVAQVYDAAIEGGPWRPWFASLANHFGASTGLLSAHDERIGSTDVLATHHFGASALQKYAEHFHQTDLWRSRAVAKLRHPEFRGAPVFLSEDLVTPAEFEASEGYNDYGKPELGGAFYLLGTIMPIEEAEICAIGLHHTRKLGDFTPTQRREFLFLYPHMKRAFTVAMRLKKAGAAHAAGVAALDALSCGVVVVDRNGAAIHANQAAEAIAAARDGFTFGRKRYIAAARQAENSALMRLVASCALPAGGGGMRLPRPSGASALEVIVVPAGATEARRLAGGAAAIIFIRDPALHEELSPQILRQLYRLTPAETLLAIDLMSGLTLNEITELRAKSRATLRTQLDGLFAKTGASRQAELIGVLSSSLARFLARRR